MNKSLLIAALTLVSASAFASKARLSALQSAAHLSDVQDVLTKPDQAAAMPEFATMEFGTAGSAATQATGSGGFVRSMGDAAIGAYLGNRPTFNSEYRNLSDSTNLLGTENGLNLFYGAKANDMTWGVGLFYSASSRKPDGTPTTANKSQDATGLSLSAATAGMWDAQLNVGLSNNSKYNTSATNENAMAGKTTYMLSGGYHMNSTYLYASYEGGGATYKNSTATLNDFAKTGITLGAVDSMKKDGTEFFYGISYVMTTMKDDGTTPTTANLVKTETARLPLIAGFESDVASWMVARGSITQSVLVDTRKVSTATAATTNNSGDSDTTLAGGIGLKFGKLTFDGTLAAASSATGTFGSDGTNFLANTSFTYMF
jgi:hypothetical protein